MTEYEITFKVQGKTFVKRYHSRMPGFVEIMAYNDVCFDDPDETIRKTFEVISVVALKDWLKR